MRSNHTIFLKDAISDLAEKWGESPPSRQQMEEGAKKLENLLSAGAMPLWDTPPLFVSFTLDDMMGQGISIINRLAAACGMDVRFLGLNRTKEEVVRAVLDTKPQLIGFTILQFDTGEEARFIRDHIPPHIPMSAGGPLFKTDPALAKEWGIDFPCHRASDFLKILPKIRSDGR